MRNRKPREIVLGVRLTIAELKIVQLASTKVGLNASTFMRNKALPAAKRLIMKGTGK